MRSSDRAVLASFAARGDLDDFRPEQTLCLDGGFAPVTEMDIISDVERDEYARVVESHFFDRADSKPETCTGAPGMSPPASAK